MITIAIDPGADGAIAWGNQEEVFCKKMPDTPRDICSLLEGIQIDCGGKCFCWIEDVGYYRAGNSGPAAVTFAEHCGNLKAFLIALRIRHDKVTPSKWMNFFVGQKRYPKIPKSTKDKDRKRILDKRKRERKNKIKIKAQGLYPDLNITLATADALGIFNWAVRKKLTG